MADNSTADPGSGGDVFATDDVGGIHYQRVKLTDGTADSSTVIASGGGTETNALRVTIASDSTGVVSVDDNGASLTVDGTVTADTELPAAAALADNFSNPTAPAVGAFVMGFDGTNWDRIRGTSAAGLDVNVTALPALAAGTNNIGDVDVLSIAAGTNAIGNVGLIPRTTGGVTPFRFNDIDDSEEEVKGSAGQVFGWSVYNDGALEVYFHIYNDTAANVTVGSTTPLVTLGIPAGSGANAFTDIGIAFGTAITIAATNAHDGTGGPAANQVVGTLFYA